MIRKASVREDIETQLERMFFKFYITVYYNAKCEAYYVFQSGVTMPSIHILLLQMLLSCALHIFFDFFFLCHPQFETDENRINILCETLSMHSCVGTTKNDEC